mmetsp:Transcript_14834/g.48596  ORF Transcript_14834/g.48596 Transcript_14834/m.48596 type:complete len:406 (+) Transcript_14834:102-1319(+)
MIVLYADSSSSSMGARRLEYLPRPIAVAATPSPSSLFFLARDPDPASPCLLRLHPLEKVSLIASPSPAPPTSPAPLLLLLLWMSCMWFIANGPSSPNGSRSSPSPPGVVASSTSPSSDASMHNSSLLSGSMQLAASAPPPAPPAPPPRSISSSVCESSMMLVVAVEGAGRAAPPTAAESSKAEATAGMGGGAEWIEAAAVAARMGGGAEWIEAAGRTALAGGSSALVASEVETVGIAPSACDCACRLASSIGSRNCTGADDSPSLCERYGAWSVAESFSHSKNGTLMTRHPHPARSLRRTSVVPIALRSSPFATSAKRIGVSISIATRRSRRPMSLASKPPSTWWPTTCSRRITERRSATSSRSRDCVGTCTERWYAERAAMARSGGRWKVRLSSGATERARSDT